MTYIETFRCTCGALLIDYEWESQDPDTGKPMGKLITMEIERGSTQQQNPQGELWPGVKDLCPICLEELQRVQELREKWFSVSSKDD